MSLSLKQRAALEFLRQTASSDVRSRRMHDFASGTLSSLRKAGLIQRVRDHEGLTAYRLTPEGLAEISCPLCKGTGRYCNYHGDGDCACAADCSCVYERSAS